MSIEENLEYFKSLTSMLPRIIYHDNSAIISKKYQHNPSGEKKRKLKHIKDIHQSTGDNNDILCKGISVEKVPSLHINELKDRLNKKILEAQEYQRMKDEKRLKLKAKRKETKEKPRKIKTVKQNTYINDSIVEDVKSEKGGQQLKLGKNKIQFSKIETKTQQDIHLLNTKKHKRKKNLDKMLSDAKNQKKKLKALQKNNDKKSTTILDDKTWKKAISMAKGEKQNDNPELIVKTIKRREQKKKKSAKEWSTRIGGQKKIQKEKQKKRQENIVKRKEARKKGR